MRPSGYQTYKEQSLTTMTQGELLLTLYDELQKRLTRAELSLKNNEYVVFDHSVSRCAEIVDYLNSTLDTRYPISMELRRMYDFFKFYLARIEAGRDPKRIQELKALVKELRDAFAEAERSTSR